MIKKEELMLGNLVLYQDEPCKVTILSDNGSIGVRDKRDATTVVQDKKLEPIIIDRQVLQDLGFTIENGLFGSFTCKVIHLDSFSIHISNNIGWDGIFISFYEGRNHNILKQGVAVRYVHELQNAIRLCTHKDLEVSLCSKNR